jgi:hypothetical protein
MLSDWMKTGKLDGEKKVLNESRKFKMGEKIHYGNEKGVIIHITEPDEDDCIFYDIKMEDGKIRKNVWPGDIGSEEVLNEAAKFFQPTAEIKSLYAVTSEISKINSKLNRSIEDLTSTLQDGVSESNCSEVKRLSDNVNLNLRTLKEKTDIVAEITYKLDNIYREIIDSI